MSDIKFSEEQEDIFEYAQKGVNNIIVQAVAGAGKTTTLVECVKRILEFDNSKHIMLLAHNRSTRDTLLERIGKDKPNVRVYTLHGLSWRMFNEHFGFKPEINEDKYRNYINKNINTITSELYQNLSGPHKLIYKANLFEIINKARHNLKQSEREIRRMAVNKYGMELVADECHVASNILKWGRENIEEVDYNDLLCFPYEFGYYTKRYLNDIIMLDEAQDASLAQQDVVSRCFKRNTRMLAFGDKDQTINSWCGSDTEAFEHLEDTSKFNKPSSKFPLTTNYRCGRRIIEYAKKYTKNNIRAREDAHDGEVNFNASLNDVKYGDMILCRNTAPLMEIYRRKVAEGKKIYFRGEGLGRSLKEAVDCTFGATIDEIILNMKSRLISFWELITKDQDLTYRETATNPYIISLYDTIKTMESLPEDIKTRDELYLFIDNVFSNEGHEGIQLSTIHRAKGLEADNVYIICPSLVPSRLSRMDWEIEEEQHLLYVMCTRPKNSLNYVTEKEIRPSNAYSENTSFYNELINIKNEITDELYR